MNPNFNPWEVEIPHTNPDQSLYRNIRVVEPNYWILNQYKSGPYQYRLLVEKLYDFLCNHSLYHRLNSIMMKDDSNNMIYPWEGSSSEDSKELYLRHQSSHHREVYKILSEDEIDPVKKCELEVESIWCDYVDRIFSHYLEWLGVKGSKYSEKENTFRLIRHLNMEKQLKMVRMEDLI